MTRTTSISRGQGMRRSAGTLLALVLLFAACASPPPPESEALPRHPFPGWVDALEVGQTERAAVRERFGDPAEIAVGGPGAITWRYAYSEIHWAPSDPDRPEIAADGTPLPRTPGTWDRVKSGASAAGRFFDEVFVYPAPRTPQPAARSMPATVHHLELAFDGEGRLLRYRYTPQSEQVVVRLER
jgi:hypothetical protein